MIRCKPADRYTALAMEKHKPGESQQCYKSYNPDYWTDDDANVWPPFRSLSWRERGLRRGSSETPIPSISKTGRGSHGKCRGRGIYSDDS